MGCGSQDGSRGDDGRWGVGNGRCEMRVREIGVRETGKWEMGVREMEDGSQGDESRGDGEMGCRRSEV